MRALLLACVAVGCSSGSLGDCRQNCPETIHLQSQALAPGVRMTVPMVKMKVPRDAISIRGVPKEQAVHAFFDGVEVTVEDFSSVARYPDYFERFARVRSGARVFEVSYEGKPVGDVVIQAFDLGCNAAKPPCAL